MAVPQLAASFSASMFSTVLPVSKISSLVPKTHGLTPGFDHALGDVALETTVHLFLSFHV